ncbi:MAG: hypothetical protein WA869_00005, partial [Alloacidobacterium sp.]
VSLGASELLPMVAILPFVLYQLAGFGTMTFILPKLLNWIINAGILCLITASYIANRQGEYQWEKRFAGLLVVAMVIVVFYGVLKLKRLQAIYDARCPPKPAK